MFISKILDGNTEFLQILKEISRKELAISELKVSQFLWMKGPM